MNDAGVAEVARAREVERGGALPRIEVGWADGGPPAGW